MLPHGNRALGLNFLGLESPFFGLHCRTCITSLLNLFFLCMKIPQPLLPFFFSFNFHNFLILIFLLWSKSWRFKVWCLGWRRRRRYDYVMAVEFNVTWNQSLACFCLPHRIWEAVQQTYSKVRDAAQVYKIKIKTAGTKQGNKSVT